MVLIFSSIPIMLSAVSCMDEFEVIESELSQIEDVCSCETYIELGVTGQTTYISQYQLNQFIVDECIKVYGELIIDEFKRFNRCDFIMEAESEIVIDYFSGINFGFGGISIMNSTFQSCGSEMWKGIRITESKSLTFVENVMRHSFNGIYTYNEFATLYAQGNIFHNNFTSINIGNRHNSDNLSRLTLLGNVFATNPPLKDHWNPSTNLNDNLASGVWAINTRVNADASRNKCLHPNVFIRLHKGFHLTNCESTIKNNYFREFNVLPFPGYGIFANSTSAGGHRSSVVIDGGFNYSTKVGQTNFKDVPLPIYTSRTETFIRANKIEGAERAIELLLPMVRNSITRNDIEANEFGISITDNLASSMRIRQNDIVIDAGGPGNIGRGIEISSSGISANEGGITCNNISLSPGRFGILLNGVDGNLVRLNSIDISGEPNGDVSGIELRGADYNIIEYNTIMGAPDPEFFGGESNGIKLASSRRNRLKGNETDEMEFGFHFSGNSVGPVQDRNEFYDHRVGYYLDESAILGPQYYNGNQWLGTYEDFGAQSLSPHSQLNPHHVYDNLENTTYDPMTLMPAMGWFLFTNTGTHDPLEPPTEDCAAFIGVPQINFQLTRLDSLIAIDSLIPLEFTERRKWEATRYLYKKILDNDSIGSMNSPYTDFITTYSQSEIDDFYLINYLLDSLHNLPDGMVEDIEAQDSIYLVLQDSSNYWVDQWVAQPDSMHYLDNATEFHILMDSIWQMTNDWYLNWNSEKESEISTLLAQVNALSSPNVYAANEKWVLEALVHALDHTDSIPENLVVDIRGLAELCALEHGTAVYSAGAMMNHFGYDLITDMVYCEDNSQNRMVNLPLETISDLKFYPNPTTGKLTVEFIEGGDRSGSMQILNINGSQLRNWEMNTVEGGFSIDVSDLPPGTYFMRWSDDQSVQIEKLIINR